MTKPFDPQALRLLHESEEIEIEAEWPDTHEKHRVTVWIVVVGANAYVRSVNGEQGHWYRQLSANPCAAIYAEERRIPVRAAPVGDSELQLEVSKAYVRKYAQYPHDVAWIVGPKVTTTTLCLEPETIQ